MTLYIPQRFHPYFKLNKKFVSWRSRDCRKLIKRTMTDGTDDKSTGDAWLPYS